MYLLFGGASQGKKKFTLGKQIRIKSVLFKVIGVLKSKGQTGMGTSNDDIVLAPSRTVLDRLSGGRFISSIQASTLLTEKIESAQTELRSIMRESHKLVKGEEDDFTIRDQSILLKLQQKYLKFLLIYWGLSLVFRLLQVELEL